MIIICDQCGHPTVVATTGLVASRSSTAKRVIAVLAKYPDGIRRNHLRREIGSAYRHHLPDALELLEAEKLITIGDARIKLT
jgi:hypothetical protein